ncbi:probable plastid-lipid-associated protein 4, chloroplastic [Rutidosis leptorrhynchoides]|uniref:probable plastid-lipid-associated protein 4, chloroplastic n=1 Tax=Rutidosis leptorrhynchoides TaxID=125765 RepID=UPI003A997A7C
MALSSSSLNSVTIFSQLPPISSSSSVPNLPFNFGGGLSVKPNSIIHINSTTNNKKWRAKVSFFPAFFGNKNKDKDAKLIKEELLEAIEPLDRGADASIEDQQRIDQIARKLEAVNPTKEPLKSDLLNGKWELIYTTSKSILQTERPKILRSVRNFQAINTDVLRAQNMESRPFFNQVTANLTPLNSRKVAVQFDTFKILGLIPVKAPGRARGELEITYLDEDLRVSRGDKGNLFVLKMVDPSYRVPV